MWNLSLSTSDPSVKDPDKLTDKLSAKSLKFINGVLDPSTLDSITIQPIQFSDTSGIPAMPTINWDLWTVKPTGAPRAGGQSGLTQFSQASAVSSFTQNGKAAATLADVRIADGGHVIARYTDGSDSEIARIALGDVRNPDTLIGIGNNIYRAATDTVVLPPAEPQTGGVGNIIGESLESSNVDIAQEFTDLITFQRSYQANSRVISTIDQLTQETINLKQ